MRYFPPPPTLKDFYPRDQNSEIANQKRNASERQSAGIPRDNDFKT